MKTRTAIAFASLLMPLCAAAQIGPVGGEFQVNTLTASRQAYPAVATRADGAFVVVWDSGGQYGTSSGVFGQRFDSAGLAVGTEFQSDSYTVSLQRVPAVATGTDGGFVVAWSSYHHQDGSYSGVFGQRHDSAGLVVGSEFQISTYTVSGQVGPAVVAGADGAFVAAWESDAQDGSNYGVFGQRFDSAGQAVSSEFLINTYTIGSQAIAAVAAGADGAIVVAWDSDGQDGSSDGVFGQRYDNAGQAVGTEFQVNSYTAGGQVRPAVAASADGAFVVVWGSYDQDGYESGVFGQRYDSAGQPVGTEFQVNSYTASRQDLPSVAVGADGAFVVAWDSGGRYGVSQGVFGQRYASTGQAVGTEFKINSYTPSFRHRPAVAVGADGAFVVAWDSNGQDGSDLGVFAQRFGVLPPCAGDCDRDGTLSIDELITGVAAALDLLPIDNCPEFDADKSGEITIDELVAAVDAALHGCTD